MMKQFYLLKPTNLVVAIAAILLGGAVVFAANISIQDSGPFNGFFQDESPRANWDHAGSNAWIVIYASQTDDPQIGERWLSLNITRIHLGEVDGVDSVHYSASASATVNSNFRLKGNAWVRIPNKGVIHDKNPGGTVDIGGDLPTSTAWASGSATRWSFGVGINRRLEASASISGRGVTNSVRISARGI